jgi:hypothetical protein
VVIEAYPAPVDGKITHWCNVGFVPSHRQTDGATITPVVGHNIHQFGGWWFEVSPEEATNYGEVVHGWTPLRPCGAAAGDDAAAADTSAYATTDVAPPVPAGGAVELAVDYAAGTCRVAFYTPAAVAGGFGEAPHAKMELRFVATAAEDDVPDWGAVPARSVPTVAADSRVWLHPAVGAGYSGAVWSFA